MRWKRWLTRLAIGAAAFVALLVVAWHVAIRVGDFPMQLLDREAATSLAVVDANGLLLRQEATSAGTKERWVSLDQISPHLIEATLASEDNDFYEHGGVDWSAMARAAWLNLKGGEFGGSTITMQLVRMTANPRRTLRGKVSQMIDAARLERQLTKKQILEQYFNRVYYGNGAWGAQQAARVYFDKDAHELSVGEAALLAVIPRGPSYYDPFFRRERTFARRDYILGLMQKHGYISREARELAVRVPIDLDKTRPSFRAPHFVELVKKRLPEGYAKGATVHTTLDADLQTKIEVALQSHLANVHARNITQAAVVVLRNRDGAILAMVGSKDFHDSAANGAFDGVTARLRPGSTLKPFVYGAAFERGDTPATIAEDVVLPEDAHQFYSKDVRAHGFARYRESLAGSYNLSAVHTLQRVGLPTVLRKLRDAGLGTLDRPDESYDWGLAIGHAEVRLLDLTAAFTTFARGGIPVIPRAIDGATTSAGTWREAPGERKRIFSEEVSWLVYDVLRDPDARKPMFGDRVPLVLPFDVALKTGTTKAYTDLWAIGVTREYTVGVWAGNFDGSPTHHVMSTEGATPLVRATYTAIAARFGDPTEVPRPAAIVSAEICPVSGKRRGPHCEHGKREVFVAGHVPEETCDWHQVVCGTPTVIYPPSIKAWARYVGKPQPPVCPPAAASANVAITYPVDGARFQLEPHRPATSQRPPLQALPADPALRWTIDGEPADAWVPTPGTHRVQVARGDAIDAVTIIYE